MKNEERIIPFSYIYIILRFLMVSMGLKYQYDQELVSPGILLDAGERRATDRRISSFYSPDVSLVVRTKKPKRRPNISLSEFDVSGGSSAGPSPIVEKVKADTQYIYICWVYSSCICICTSIYTVITYSMRKDCTK